MTARRPHRAGNWFRKLPIREEPAFAVLSLLARALEAELRKFTDDAGVIELGGRSPAEAVALFGGARSRSERRQLHTLLEELEAGGALLVRDGRLVLLRMVAELAAEGGAPVPEVAPACTHPVLSLHSSGTEPALIRYSSGTELGFQLDLSTRNCSEPEGKRRGEERRIEERRGEILPSVGSAREQIPASDPEAHIPTSVPEPDPGSGPTGLDLNPIATPSSAGDPTPIAPAPGELDADDAEPGSERAGYESPALRQRATEVTALCGAKRADVAAGTPAEVALPRSLGSLGLMPSAGEQQPPAAPASHKPKREPKPPTRKAPRARPAGWEPSAAHVEQGMRLGFRKHRVIGEAEKFCGHWDAAGKMWADWDAAFGCWLRKAREIDDRNGVPPDEPDEPLFEDRRHLIPAGQEFMPEELRGLTGAQLEAKLRERRAAITAARKKFEATVAAREQAN